MQWLARIPVLDLFSTTLQGFVAVYRLILEKSPKGTFLFV